MLCIPAQGAALDHGRIVVVQPLLVTSVVWALPLGYWLTQQHIERRQVLGAGVVVVGLALFVLVGDPDQGVDDTSTAKLLIAAAVVSGVVLAALAKVKNTAKTPPAIRAAVLGGSAGLWFGLGATFSKPVLADLHVSIGEAAGDWRSWALIGFSVGGFVLHQLALSTGQLAPAVAAVSTANPVISVVLGIFLFQERLTRPGWHVVIGVIALLAALYGVIMITMANRTTEVSVGGEPRAGPRPNPALS